MSNSRGHCPTDLIRLVPMKRPKQVEVATKRPKKRKPASGDLVRIVDKPSVAKREVTALQMAVIQQLARGQIMADVARRFQLLLVPHEPDRKKRLKKARIRIRTWLSTEKMRDLLWEETMVGLDIDSPQIVRGIARKAKAGRVDAARLAFELNGRHTPQAEVTPAQINIQFGNIPRPRRDHSNPEADIEIDPDDVVEIEDD